MLGRKKYGKYEASTVRDKPGPYRRANAGRNKQMAHQISVDNKRCEAAGYVKGPPGSDARNRFHDCVDRLAEERWRKQDAADARWRPLRGAAKRKRRRKTKRSRK